MTDEGKARLKQALLAWSAVNHRVEQVLGPESAAMLRALADQVASDEFLQAYREAKARQCPASTKAATGAKGSHRLSRENARRRDWRRTIAKAVSKHACRQLAGNLKAESGE